MQDYNIKNWHSVLRLFVTRDGKAQKKTGKIGENGIFSFKMINGL